MNVNKYRKIGLDLSCERLEAAWDALRDSLVSGSGGGDQGDQGAAGPASSAATATDYLVAGYDDDDDDTGAQHARRRKAARGARVTLRARGAASGSGGGESAGAERPTDAPPASSGEGVEGAAPPALAEGIVAALGRLLDDRKVLYYGGAVLQR